MRQALRATNYVLGDSGDNLVSEWLDFNDLYNTFKINWQLNSAYEISFTATYTDQYKDAFNLLQMKRGINYNGKWYFIQQLEEGHDENDLITMQVTANAMAIDLMKNIRIDPSEPTEDRPDSGDSGGGSSDKKPDPTPGTITVTKTDEQQTYTLKDRLDQFMKNDDQALKLNYNLHGNFPQVAVDCSGSLFDWIGSNLATFGAFYIPNNNNIDIYDLASLRHKTDNVFRYGNNLSTLDIQSDGNDLVNDCEVFGGHMQKDITSGGGSAGTGAGGNLDDVEGFCKSPINADFGVNKQAMLQNFAARSDRVRAWGVDVNRLYDTVKNAGVSPEWFMAYELQEQGSGYGWLNHTYKQGDAYQDAVAVCNWIKQWSQSNSINPAWSAPEGSMAPNPGLQAKWNAEFGKGSIGRVYLQGTAAAVWDLAGVTPNPRIGKPITNCVNVIKSWGGHTNKGSAGSSSNNDGGWGWPFPGGEGHFMGAQLFGKNPGGEFRPNGFHDGLDFGSMDHPGNEVHAVHGGKVTVGPAWGTGGVGWYVVITDSTGLSVEYQEAFSNASNIHVHVGDTVHLGDVIGIRDGDHVHIGITRHGFPEAFSHAFSNDGTWLNPLDMIKSGGAISPGQPSSGGGGDNSTNTVSQTYYALHYHFSDEESKKKYGIHRGAPVVMDSIYDMKSLQAYAEATIPKDPPTTLSNNVFSDKNDYQLGDVSRLIVPERGIDFDVTLMGIEYNPYHPTDQDTTLTWNNTGLAMKNSIYALYQSIKNINRNVDVLDYYGAIGGRTEDHFAGGNGTPSGLQTSPQKQFTEADLEAIKKFTDS